MKIITKIIHKIGSVSIKNHFKLGQPQSKLKPTTDNLIIQSINDKYILKIINKNNITTLTTAIRE